MSRSVGESIRQATGQSLTRGRCSTKRATVAQAFPLWGDKADFTCWNINTIKWLSLFVFEERIRHLGDCLRKAAASCSSPLHPCTGSMCSAALNRSSWNLAYSSIQSILPHAESNIRSSSSIWLGRARRRRSTQGRRRERKLSSAWLTPKLLKRKKL